MDATGAGAPTRRRSFRVGNWSPPAEHWTAPTWRLYHRPRKGRGIRWRLVAAGLTFAEAVQLGDGPGDWWLTNRPEQGEAEGDADDLPRP